MLASQTQEPLIKVYEVTQSMQTKAESQLKQLEGHFVVERLEST